MEACLREQGLTNSPAFIVDETAIRKSLRDLAELREESGCKVLYSMKALPLQPVVELAAQELDGISVSSLFEARLAREFIGADGSIHLTSPGLRGGEFAELSKLCSHISFNSPGQWQTLAAKGGEYSPGLRINPKLSFLNDLRFDPCRPHSKLGIDIELLDQLDWAGDVEGLHFHTVFSCQDFSPLLRTMEKIINALSKQASPLKWLNLGGGYLFSQIEDKGAFVRLVKALKGDFALDVYIEPGKDIVGRAGYLCTRVIDRFDSDGKTVLIVDSTVNHHPEIFEYQRAAELLNPQQGEVPVILAGSSCLAGDLFGEYRFDKTPEIGERIVFKNLGAYSLIKANRFNGYNLPTIYNWDGKNLMQLKQDDYQDYRKQWRVGG